ncbi:MAG: hypothetical protein VX899_25295 [Myxococcota bacterium]|nr:hypothetical protein [Myxococcota bacterium]
MNAELRPTLKRLLAQAPRLHQNPRRLEAFLRDLHPEDLREVSVLVEAAERGCVDTLMSFHHDGRELNRLARELSTQSAMAMRWAIWALELWAEVVEAGPAQADTPQEREARLIQARDGSIAQVLATG